MEDNMVWFTQHHRSLWRINAPAEVTDKVRINY
jgi:hypothetical protein